jgi:hypothetical protein
MAVLRVEMGAGVARRRERRFEHDVIPVSYFIC